MSIREQQPGKKRQAHVRSFLVIMHHEQMAMAQNLTESHRICRALSFKVEFLNFQKIGNQCEMDPSLHEKIAVIICSNFAS